MWRRGDRRRRTDEGFSLIEVILAMVIIAGVLATMLGVVVSSLTTIAQARQRQTATALATQAIERLRALPYDTVTQSDPVETPAVTAVYAVPDGPGYALRTTLQNLSLDEELVVNEVSGRTEDFLIDGVTYRVHTYVSLAAVTAGGQQPFNFTAIVAYTSSVSDGERVTAQRSVAFSPAGCLSTAQNPFAAPCQAYFTANAGQALGGIIVSNPDDSELAMPGFATAGPGRASLEIGLPANSATVLVEQTATGNASAMTSGTRRIDAGETATGSVSAAAAVDSDPSSTPAQEESVTASQSASSLSVSGTAGTLTVSPYSSDSERAAAAVFADTTYCTDGTAAGAGLTTGPAIARRPCASSNVDPSGSDAAVVYSPNSPGGFNSMNLTVLSASPGTVARAVAAQIAAPNSDVCTAGTGPTGMGCAFARATRNVGTVRLGVPVIGSTAPLPGWNNAFGIVHLSGLTETVRAEEGAGNRAPAYTRTGTLNVYNGTGYTQVVLGPAISQTIPVDTMLTYTSPSGKLLTLHYTGQVLVQAASTERTPATRTGDLTQDCKDQACVTEANGGSAVVINVTVSVLEGGAEIGRFGVATDLGGLLAQTTYKEAADA